MSTEPPAEGEALAPEEAEPLARDIMTVDVVTVSPDLSVKDLAALFREQRIGGVPVVEGGRLVGIVTEGDMMALDADISYPHWFELFDSIIYLGSQKKFREQLEKAAAADVRQLMTHRDKVQTIGPDEPARKAATLMVKHHFDRVPVVEEDDFLVGLITRHDIMKLIGL
jgi:CBS domain-containing protein